METKPLNASNWRDLVTTAATDRNSGATSITRTVAEALLGLAQESRNDDRIPLARQVEQVAAEVAVGQRSMASIMWLLSDALMAADTQDAIGNLEHVAQDWLRHVKEAPSAIAARVIDLLTEPVSVVTISNSSAVSISLIALHQKERIRQVTCLESRPQLEGRALAETLACESIDTRLVVDAALYEAVASAEVVLLGADALAESGVINKTGSAALAALGSVKDIKVYVITDSRKVWPKELSALPPIEGHSRAEIWDAAPSNIRVVNTYFEPVEWKYVDTLITDRELYRPAIYESVRPTNTLHPRLLDILADFV
jgi:translation initiation factor 2B subunit (eIF-2B alpha/beta/delta family)